MQNTESLPSRVTLYDEIEEEYLLGLQNQGLRFETQPEASTKAALVDELASRGAAVRNGGASISINQLSSACVACTGDPGSKTFLLSLMCDRECYFCFNPNQDNYEEERSHIKDWRAELNAFDSLGIEASHVALTGGEPLLHKEQMLAFFVTARNRYPSAHTRLYTTGDRLDTDTLEALADAKLTEIRFSIKMDDPPETIEQTLQHIAEARDYIPQVMVEMPVIPGTGREMRALLDKLDELTIFGINLLEFCFPLFNWSEFEKRGFALKNPPFPVLYDYRYAGGLPVAGSEELALELLRYALDNKLSLGVHYCSLENKHRDEIYQQNMPYKDAFELYRIDPDDFFLKTLLVFDEDAENLKPKLAQAGIPFEEDLEDRAVQFSPEYLQRVLELDNRARLYCSYNVAIERDKEIALRELKIRELSC